MKENFESKKMLNLVLFELEKYCSNIANHPSINHECHYSALRTKTAPLHRAVHWYLHDNGLVYQTNKLISIKTNEQKKIWVLKKFEKLNICQKIIEKYDDYLNLFLDDFKTPSFTISYYLEEVLRNKGINNELNKTFESMNKLYEGDIDLSISEYNKFLLTKYAKIINK
jgi:hypothetical protein